MPEEIASDAALSFSPEAVHLQRRIGDEWRETDHVRFDGADMRAGLARIRQGLAEGEDARPAVLLVIPDDQLLYTRLRVNADGPSAMPAAIARALDGLTPYPVEALAFDWLSAGPGAVHVAAVARQTLAEAEAFALRHGFAIRGFIADPDPERYPGEPNFIHPLPADAQEPSVVAKEDGPAATDARVASESAPDEAPAEAEEPLSAGPADEEPADRDEEDDEPVQSAVDHARLAASLDRLRALATAAGPAPEAASAEMAGAEASTDEAPAEAAPDAALAGDSDEAAAPSAEVPPEASVDDAPAEAPPVPLAEARNGPESRRPADPVVTRIPPSVPYPVVPKAEAAAEPQKAARLGGQHRPADVAPIAAGAATAVAAPATIVRHGETETAANDSIAPAGVARRLLVGRHGPLTGLVALLLAAMLLAALFAGRGGQEVTLADRPAPVQPEVAVTPAAEPAAVGTAIPSPADQVQAAADDALGNALRQALAQPVPPAGVAAPPSATAAPVVADPVRSASAVTSVTSAQAPATPVVPVQSEDSVAAPETPASVQAPAPAASPVQSDATVATSALPAPAQPAPAMVPQETTAPVPHPAGQAAVPAAAASVGAIPPQPAPAEAIAAGPAPEAAAAATVAPQAASVSEPVPAPQAATAPAPRAAPAPAAARPAAKPAQRPAVADPSPAAAVPASRPAARPAAPPRRASPVPPPAATPAAQLQRSIRPPTRPMRSGKLLLPAPENRFAADRTPQGLDPAAFAIPVRLAIARLPDSLDAPRYAQARPMRKPGGGASAVDAALREAVAAPAARPGASASTVPAATAAAAAAVRPGPASGRPARKPGGGGGVPRTDGAAVESAIASAIQASTVPPRAEPGPVPGALRSSALPPRRSGMPLPSAAPAVAAGVAVPGAGTRMAAVTGPDTTAQIAAAAQAAQDAAATERRRIDEDLQAQAEARIRARADADTQAEARARAQAEARARAQAEAEERAARARGGSYRPAEIDDEPEIADTGGGTTSQTVAQNATVRRGLDTNRTTLIGVIGAGKASRGLIRLRNGRVVTVRIGDRIDGGTITAIGDGAVTYAVGGRPRQLKILDGR